MSETQREAIRRLVREADRDRLEAAFMELLKSAMVMQESDKATLTWLRKQLGGK